MNQQRDTMLNIDGFYQIGDQQLTPILTYDVTWLTACSTILSSPITPIVQVTGPKNTGKSTLSKSIINALLEKQ